MKKTYIGLGLGASLITLISILHKEENITFTFNDFSGTYKENVLNLDINHLSYFLKGNLYRNEMDFTGKGDTVHIEDVLGERTLLNENFKYDIPEKIEISGPIHKFLFKKSKVLSDLEEKMDPKKISISFEQYKEGIGLNKGYFLDNVNKYNNFRERLYNLYIKRKINP